MKKILTEEDNQFLDTVSANVTKIRKEKGYSQLDLATEIGYANAAYYGKIEIRKDGHHFHIVQLAKIAKVLDADICDFFKTK